MTSTLDGYTPEVGDTVWQQMYNPQQPRHDSTIEERVKFGVTYGKRRKMIVVGVVANDRYPISWQLLPSDPANRHGEYPWSLVGADWCVLEPVDPGDDGRMF